MTSRALALLAAFASPLFMAAAIAGWLSGAWPATPLTLFVSAFAVIGGPVLGLVHVATADDEDTIVTLRPATAVRSRKRIAVDETPRLAAARRFHNWRDNQNDVLTLREREEHLRRNALRARELRRIGRV
jgi:putative intracellular protease/amidase